MKFTNTQKGPRGLNTVAGPILVDPGQTVEAEVYARESVHIDATGWFDVDGHYTSDPEPVSAVTTISFQPAAGKDGVYIPSVEFNAMREAFEALTANNRQLQDQLAGREKPSEDPPALDRDDLKKQADELGLQYAPNIKTERLKELIDEKRAS